MAGFEIPESVRVYFDDTKLQAAVDALVEVLQGDEPPDMDWTEAKAYNRALLMASQVRADHNDMLFNLWDRVFGAAINIPRKKFEVEFEGKDCIPEKIFADHVIWQTMSRDGLDDEDLEMAYELRIMHNKHIIYLAIIKWNAEENVYVDFEFSPHEIDGEYWKQYEDEDVTSARSALIPITDFLDDPEPHIMDMQQAAQAMVAYISKII